MTAPRTGSRYELQIDRAGARQSKVEKDYFAIHAADLEEVAEEDDLVGYVHSYEIGTTVDGPGLRFVAFLSGACCAASTAITRYLAQTQRPPSDRLARNEGDWQICEC